MAHIVKCRWCNESFDTEKLESDKWIMPVEKHYYHTDCFLEKQKPGALRPEKQGDDFSVWSKNIFDFIQRDLKGECNYSRISQQMKQFKIKNKDWTYKGMYFALKYFYEIKKNDWNKSNGGVGILPYIYYEGTEYWRELNRKQKGIIEAIEKQIEERKNKETIKIKRKNQNTKKDKYNLDEI